MKKYKDLYYTTSKTKKGYNWKIFSIVLGKGFHLLSRSEGLTAADVPVFFETKREAELNAIDSIDDFYD